MSTRTRPRTSHANASARAARGEWDALEQLGEQICTASGAPAAGAAASRPPPPAAAVRAPLKRVRSTLKTAFVVPLLPLAM